MPKPKDLYRGTVEKRGKGVWRIRVSLGWDNVEKKYIRSPSRTVHGTKAQAYTALEEYKAEIRENGNIILDTDLTVDKYAEMFHSQRKDYVKSPLAYTREGIEVAKIMEYFKDYPLDELNAFSIRQIYDSLRKNDVISKSELHHIHIKLKQILQQAVDDLIIRNNPALSISVPRPAPKDKRNSLTKDMAREFYKVLEDGPLTAKTTAVYIGLETGMRRGEVLGLLWENVHFDVPAINVCLQYAADMNLREPKSESGKRIIRINQDCADYLMRWKEEQKRTLDALREKLMGETPGCEPNAFDYLIQTGKTPVITNEVGRLTDPNIFSRWFRSFCVKHGFGTFEEGAPYIDAAGRKRVRKNHYRGLRFHELRHTQATLLLGGGTDIKTVQHRLGHTDPHFTAKVYAHALPENDQSAADAIGKILKGGCC